MQTRRRAAFGGVEQMRSGRWRARYIDINGVRQNAPSTFDEKAEARAWLDEVRKVVQEQRLALGLSSPPPPTPSVVAEAKKRQYRKAKEEPPPDELPAKLMSVQDAAARLGLSHWTIRDYIRDGKLTKYRVGPKLVRVDVAEVEALVLRHP